MDINAPIDTLHQDCAIAQAEIRRQVKRARRRVSQWDIMPCPDGWRGPVIETVEAAVAPPTQQIIINTGPLGDPLIRSTHRGKQQ